MRVRVGELPETRHEANQEQQRQVELEPLVQWLGQYLALEFQE